MTGIGFDSEGLARYRYLLVGGEGRRVGGYWRRWCSVKKGGWLLNPSSVKKGGWLLKEVGGGAVRKWNSGRRNKRGENEYARIKRVRW